MSSPFTVTVRRLQIIVTGGAARLLAALSSVILSIVIVRTQSSALWGEVVPFMLMIEFSFSLIGWGALPYLVQKFSLHPHQIKSNWNQVTFSRSWLLLLLWITIIFLSISPAIKISLIIWATGRYVFQSFEPIAQVERNFLFSILMELSSILLIAIPIVLAKAPLKVDTIIFLFSASMVWKAGLSVIFFRHWISPRLPDLVYFREAFPFFLLTLSGMLQQRTDLYCVTYFLNDQDTAVYQVYFNFLIFCQFLSSLLLSPFAKNIFRLPVQSLRKLERKFILAGIPLTLASVTAIWVMIRYFYHFELSWFMYILGYFYILMFYQYLLRNYEMGKAYQQSTVALYGFLGSAVNLVLCIILIPSFGKEGALLSGSVAQGMIVLLYYRTNIPTHDKR